MAGEAPWWQTAVIYQIYPLSFLDSNGDGMGDLAGITAKLDYLSSLGINAIWLSPIYVSPMVDFGYDVSDHKAINPVFGSMEDFDALVAEVHRREMRLILDFVPNHTSSRHPWFVESSASRENPKREWYVWRDPNADGGRPNNWTGYFGPAWTLDRRTGQYYLHQHRHMPELNYDNPAVLEEMLSVLAFWLDKGVDGFRVDVISLLGKDGRFNDEPENPDYLPHRHPYYSLDHVYTVDQPRAHDVIREMRRVLDAHEDRVMLGELEPIPSLMSYYGADLDECHLPFNLSLLHVDWKAETIRIAVEAYEEALPPGAWPNWILGNHDQPRIAGRVGTDQVRIAQMLLLTLRGTPICYYGDEIGMSDVDIPVELMRDAMGHAVDPRFSRDPERTPMQWTAGPNAGFTSARPWLPIAADHTGVNVDVQERDPGSLLNLFRALTALRGRTNALSHGDHRSIDHGLMEVFAYERYDADSRILVALNFADTKQALDAGAERGHVLLSTHLDRSGDEGLDPLCLRPHEGLIVRLRPQQ
jgi:alpha-glucosidase